MNSMTSARRQRLVRMVTAAASAVALAACGGGGSGNSATANPSPAPAGAPAVVLSTSAMIFTPVQVGSPEPVREVTISNSGTGALTLLSTASSTSAFRTSGGTCAPGATIAPGSSCTIGVAFAPSAAGSTSASLVISHNATPSTSSVALSAFATAVNLSAGAAPSLGGSDCARLASGDQAIASLVIQGADMQQVSEILRAVNAAHAYQVFARAPLNVMWWLRAQSGPIDMVTIGAAIHESNHEIDFALRSRCNTDGFARLLLNGSVQTTGLVSGNGTTANYSIAAETVPPALKTGLRYSTYVTGAASASGNDFSVLLDELNAYAGGTQFEIGLLSDPIYRAVRADGDFNAGGQVDFMLYALAYLKSARLNHPTTYGVIRNQAATIAYLQKLWTQAESNLSALYPHTVISGSGGMVVSKDALAAAYSPEFIVELDFLGVSHQSAGAWAATYLR